MELISKDMLISDVLMMDQGVVPIFMGTGMHCLGCAMSQMENIEEACAVHGIDADALVDELNEYFKNKSEE